MPVEEPMEEEEVGEKADMGEVPPTRDSVPERAPVPQVTLPAAARFWAGVPSNQVAGKGLATSSRAWGKVPTVQAEQPPWLRQMKSWLAGSRWKKWQWRRLAREKMQPP